MPPRAGRRFLALAACGLLAWAAPHARANEPAGASAEAA
jgi:hypothetical protein